MTIASIPWHASVLEAVAGRLNARQLPHALMICGEAGVGKADLAGSIAHLLVCEHPDLDRADACGECKQCQLVSAGSHPDIRRYAPEKKSRVIKVDQVRALSAFAVVSPQVAQRKIIIVDRADVLNISAGNALLKTLEEPSGDVMLLLLQETGRPVLPTLRSRCQQLIVATPSPEVADHWLADELNRHHSEAGVSAAQREQALRLARYAPLRALSYLLDDFLGQRGEALNQFRGFMKGEASLADATRPFKTLGLEQTLWLMEVWATDLARMGAGGEGADAEAADMLRYLSSVNPPHRAHRLLDSLYQSRAAMVNNVSAELETERLLIEWRSLMPTRRARAG